jgi:protein-S-isoprenylcysteine O-methyltransferase Ste14
MEKKMAWEGSGPKLFLITLPYIILAVIVSRLNPEFLKMNFIGKRIGNISGYILLLAGLIFYVSTVIVFFKEFNKGKLITSGTYSLCRNPIYATFIVFIIPALALLFQSGLIVTIDAVLYLNFKVLIHLEYNVLKEQFGTDYEKYEHSVNEIIPLPKIGKKSK